jgi:glycosyltransferase involved in cell wall biosynthesis
VRIAFITLGFEPFRTSGFDVSGERLVKGLLAAGHLVRVIAAGDAGLQETVVHPGLKVFRLPLGKTNWIGYAYQAVQLLNLLDRNEHFDIIHFWDVHFAFTYQGRYMASLHQSFHQRRTSYRPSFLRSVYYYLAEYFAERPALRRSDHLIAVSAATRDEFLLNYGCAAEKVTQISHGIDTEFFQPDLESATRLRSHLGIAPDEPVILHVGFVTPRKGMDILAQAFPNITSAPRLVIVGKWSETYSQSFLAQVGSAKNRVLPAGFVPDQLMPAYYSMADVLVIPSWLEGFGLPAAEALACETPVVASRVPSLVEVAGPGGIFIEPGNAHELQQAISNLLIDDRLKKELGTAGRDHIINSFSVNGMVKSTLEVYSQNFR